MLSEQEKQEMLEDGFNAKRRADFAYSRRHSANLASFEDYLQFLTSLQHAFPAAVAVATKSVSKFKL